MKKAVLYITMCVTCLAIGTFFGSYITKHKAQQEQEIAIHNSIVQELDDYSDALLEAAAIFYAGNAYNMYGEKFSPDTFVVRVAEQTARFVSKFLNDLDAHRRLNGVGGVYSYYPIEYPMALIRSEAASIAKNVASSFPVNASIYEKSPWDNDIQIDKQLLPCEGGRASFPFRPEKVEDEESFLNKRFVS